MPFAQSRGPTFARFWRRKATGGTLTNIRTSYPALHWHTPVEPSHSETAAQHEKENMNGWSKKRKRKRMRFWHWQCQNKAQSLGKRQTCVTWRARDKVSQVRWQLQKHGKKDKTTRRNGTPFCHPAFQLHMARLGTAENSLQRVSHRWNQSPRFPRELTIRSDCLGEVE